MLLQFLLFDKKLNILYNSKYMSKIPGFLLKLVGLISGCFFFSYLWFFVLANMFGLISSKGDSIWNNVVVHHAANTFEFILVLPFFGGIALCIMILPVYLVYLTIKRLSSK
jgi:hypothetical protein